MQARHHPWLLCCLLILIALSLPFPVVSANRTMGQPPHVLLPNPVQVEQWRQEGKPLPPFVTAPALYVQARPARRTAPLDGVLNVLAIVVDFSDKEHTVTATFFDSFMFALPVPGRGSVRDYWSEVSYGQVDIVTVDLPSAIDWVRAPSSYNYYTNGQYCIGSYPNNCQKLAEEVVDAVDAIVDFSAYDNDGDGYTEPIVLIHAGPEGFLTGDPWDIWGHSWTMGARNHDGVWINRYTITAEYWATVEPGWSDMTIGPVCHEMGHGFWDMPDMYDYDGSSVGLGRYSLMSNGWTNGPNAGAWGVDGSSPAWPDAWDRLWAGFDAYENLLAPADAFAFMPVETTPGAVMRLKSGPLTIDEYFLLENRQPISGTYDEYLPANGLFIWHVEERYGNNNNECRSIPHCSGECATTHYLAALEQADGLDDLEFRRNLGDAADTFPGSGNRTYWQPYLEHPGINPESGSWTDTDCQSDSCIDLTDIACILGGDCTAHINRAGCLHDPEMGDAPTSQNHFTQTMTAYAPVGPLPAVPAGFPTVYQAVVPGPRHHYTPADAWLGAGTSGDFEADTGPDEDGMANITPTLDLANLDGLDDGLALPAELPPCGSETLAYTLTVAPDAPYAGRYLNAWFDWNRDGDWGDILTCTGGITTSEWAVQNAVVSRGAGVYHLFTPALRPWIHVTTGARWEAWMRFSLAEAPAPLPGDGRGPAGGYEYGETEDYYLYLSPTLAMTSGLVAAPAHGDLVTYTLLLSGLGNVAAPQAVLSDVLPLGVEYVASNPPGTYDPAARSVSWDTTLTPGEATTRTVAVQVTGQQGEEIANAATLSWGGSLWTTAATTFTIGCAPDDPQAAFIWTVPACPSETVQFSNLSTGTLPITLGWDLDGDGAVDSSLEAPAWHYPAPGMYTVTLTATNTCGQSQARAAVTVLEPLDDLELAGPAALWAGQAATYMATAVPADPPPSYAWSNGTLGATSAYSWTLPGLYTIAVTASNGCSQLTATLDVLVTACTTLRGISVSGPARLHVGQEGTFLATPEPLTATQPLYRWSNGGTEATSVYSWTLAGTYAVTVTATNCLDVTVQNSAPVQVWQEFRIYLPIVAKAGP
jgi:immune inhibitor A